MAERGSLDLLGPSTKRAVEAVLAGTPPEEAGAAGATNGAAMRIAPVGIAVPGLPVRRPRTASTRCTRNAAVGSGRPGGRGEHVTHNTGIALAGAAAVAAAVSAGVGGATVAEATDAGHPGRARSRPAAATGWRAPTSRPASSGPPAWSRAGPRREAAELIYTLVGTSLATQESVPAAFAVLAAVPDDPWRACLLAASLGGDCDTIAAMAGAIAGACHGLGAFPPEAIAVIDAQGLGLAALADDLLALRGRAGTGAAMSQPAISRLVFAGRGDRRPADAGARAARTRRRHARGIGVRRGGRRVQHHGRGRQAGPARRLRGRPRHRAVGRPGPRGPGRRGHQAAPPARPGRGTPASTSGLVEADGERTFVTALGAESLREPDAWDLVRLRPGDAVLRLGLRPGPGRVGPGPRRLGGQPAARGPAVRRSRPAGRGHPRGGARPGAGPLRLVELQPARGRPAHRQRRPGRGGPPPGRAGPAGPTSSSGPARTAACWPCGCPARGPGTACR